MDVEKLLVDVHVNNLMYGTGRDDIATCHEKPAFDIIIAIPQLCFEQILRYITGRLEM